MPAVAPRDRFRSSPEHDERPHRLEGRVARQLFQPGKATLDERITTVWSALIESGTAECLVCHGEVRAAHECACCGSQLS